MTVSTSLRQQAGVSGVRQARCPEESLPEGLPDFQDLFETRGAPLEVEIGCGKGKFLLGRAMVFPEIHFLGIDYAGKWMKIGRTRGEKRCVKNLKFFRTHARPLVEQYLPDASVSVFHIYFPDPWPKRRHRRRRLVSESFLGLLKQKLAAGGRIELATDDSAYFQEMHLLAESTRSWWTGVRETLNQRIFCPELKTSYELKYEAEGRPLHYLEFIL